MLPSQTLIVNHLFNHGHAVMYRDDDLDQKLLPTERIDYRLLNFTYQMQSIIYDTVRVIHSNHFSWFRTNSFFGYSNFFPSTYANSI